MAQFNPNSDQEMPDLLSDAEFSTLPNPAPSESINKDAIYSVRFLIPSFLDIYGATLVKPDGSSRKARTRFSAGPWSVTIDRLEDAQSAFSEMRKTRDHRYTHKGWLQKIDGSTFTREELDEFQNYLYHLFTFACASPRAINKLQAFNIHGQFLFEKREFDVLMGDPFALSWYPEFSENSFATLGPSFYDVWSNQDLREVAVFGISMLYESNRENMLTESKIVLGQTALELLTNKIWLEAWGNKKPADAAATMIRSLLNALNVDVAFPSQLTNLISESTTRVDSGESENWIDGPMAIVRIRNMIVHADGLKRTKLFALDDNAKVEAARLSLHYVEMCLLWLFGYDGSIAPRIDLPKMVGKIASTPWPSGGTRPGASPP